MLWLTILSLPSCIYITTVCHTQKWVKTFRPNSPNLQAEIKYAHACRWHSYFVSDRERYLSKDLNVHISIEDSYLSVSQMALNVKWSRRIILYGVYTFTPYIKKDGLMLLFLGSTKTADLGEKLKIVRLSNFLTGITFYWFRFPVTRNKYKFCFLTIVCKRIFLLYNEGR